MGSYDVFNITMGWRSLYVRPELRANHSHEVNLSCPEMGLAPIAFSFLDENFVSLYGNII